MQDFVGRQRELAEMIDLIPTDARSSGAGRLIVGQAGIGKTRLAQEIARSAADAGVTVVWGRCWDDGTSPPYWPWVQIVRSLLGVDRGTDLAELVLGESGRADRFELFDATSQVVEQAAAAAPLVLVVEDLHASDPDSIALFRFLAERLSASAVLVVATHRTVDPADAHADVAAQLDALGRRVGVIELGGLGVDDVAELLPDALSATRVHAATGGNPLFVREVARLATTADRADGTLREVVSRRLDGTAEAICDLVGAMAMLGPGASIESIGAVLGSDHVESLLVAAAEADLVDLDTRSVVHPLIAEVALDRIEIERRQQWHAQAAASIADTAGRETEHASHLLAAGPAYLAEAIDAARTAASIASESMAYADAAGLLERAVAALRTDDDRDEHLHLALLLQLGEATRRGNRQADSDRVYDEAWELAGVLGDSEGLARAALRSGIRYYFTGDVAAPDAERNRQALAAQPAGPSVLRARLLANLGLKLVAADPATARACYVEAIGIARSLDDPATLGFVLLAGQITALGPSTLATRVETARQMIAIAHETGEPGLLVQGRFLLMGALLERGDIRSLDQELATQLEVLDALGDNRAMRHALWFRCMRALLDGRLTEGEELANACFELSVELGDPDGIGVYGGQVGVIRSMQGRLLEMEQVYLDLRAAEPHEPLWSAVLAFVWSRYGRLDAARGALALLLPLDDVVEGQYWLLTMASAGEAAVHVGDRTLMADVRDRLLPYADRVVPIGMGAAVWGPVARLLGLISGALGYDDERLHFLQRGVDVASRLGARPWLVEAQLDLAEAFAEVGERDRATSVLFEALSTAQQLGLDGFADRARRLRDRFDIDLPGLAAVPAVEASQHPTVSVLGGLEVRSAEGQLATWSSRKARQLLMVLVARRGVPIHREQLVEALWPDDSSGRTGNRLDVAVSTVRRALDPERAFAADELIESRGGSVRLRTDNVRVDLEEFLDAAAEALREGSDATVEDLMDIAGSYRGHAFAEEPYADWAEPARLTAASAAARVSHRIVELASARGDDLIAIESYRRLVELDRYDEDAHLGLIRLLRRNGSRGVLQQAERAHIAAMAELGIDVRRSG